MSPQSCIRTSILVLALGLGGAVSAQQEPPDDADIVVIGEREAATDREITAQARNISIIGSPLDNPLPRFEDAICPGVTGLKDEAAAYIIHRIRYNAEQLKLRLAKDDGKCEPNLIVAVIENAQDQLVELARRRGYMLAGLSVTQRGDLLDSPGAARVWVNTVMRTNTGAPAPPRSGGNTAPERILSYDPESGTAARLGMPPEATGSASHSRIYFPIREDIHSVMILFDRDQVQGKSLLQLADYATMRGFAVTRETQGDIAASTILSLFDGDGPKPDRLTPFDLAYLNSLYEGIPNLPATSKLAGVNRELRKLRGAEAANE
jgi:hypothetical protein